MKKFILALFVALSLTLIGPAVLPGQSVETVEAASKGKLKKSKNGKYYYYVNGKKVKKKWKTIKGKKYYFQKNGSAATLSTKINGKYYVFNKKGQLQKATSTKKKVVKIAGVRYQVDKKGRAVKGWSSNKKYYFSKKGKCYTGIRVINEKFYAFGENGKKDAALTKQLNSAAVYEKDFTELKALLDELVGEPEKSEYFTGCYGDGKDGILEYSNFIVYTYRDTEGKEIFMGVE